MSPLTSVCERSLIQHTQTEVSRWHQPMLFTTTMPRKDKKSLWFSFLLDIQNDKPTSHNLDWCYMRCYQAKEVWCRLGNKWEHQGQLTSCWDANCPWFSHKIVYKRIDQGKKLWKMAKNALGCDMLISQPGLMIRSAWPWCWLMTFWPSRLLCVPLEVHRGVLRSGVHIPLFIICKNIACNRSITIARLKCTLVILLLLQQQRASWIGVSFVHQNIHKNGQEMSKTFLPK